MPQAKLDLTKEYKSYYTAKTTPEIVDIEVVKLEGLWWVAMETAHSPARICQPGDSGGGKERGYKKEEDGAGC